MKINTGILTIKDFIVIANILYDQVLNDKQATQLTQQIDLKVNKLCLVCELHARDPIQQNSIILPE